jgi:hypothetical protein
MIGDEGCLFLFIGAGCYSTFWWCNFDLQASVSKLNLFSTRKGNTGDPF